MIRHHTSKQPHCGGRRRLRLLLGGRRGLPPLTAGPRASATSQSGGKRTTRGHGQTTTMKRTRRRELDGRTNLWASASLLMSLSAAQDTLAFSRRRPANLPCRTTGFPRPRRTQVYSFNVRLFALGAAPPAGAWKINLSSLLHRSISHGDSSVWVAFDQLLRSCVARTIIRMQRTWATTVGKSR